MIEGYDTMQVCLNGHKITEYYKSSPEFRQSFCSECGAKTLIACPDCGQEIKGFYHISGVFHTNSPDVPNNCHGCGTAYPWRQQALAAAVEMLQMQIDSIDQESAERIVGSISIDGPRTELESARLKKLMEKLQKPAYDAVVSAVGGIMSESAKRMLGW